MGNRGSRPAADGQPPRAALPPPAFDVLGVLGAGAHGEVTKRRFRRTGELLAVKAVPYSLLRPERRARVQREAMLLESLVHEHVVRFRGVWLKPGALHGAIHGEVLIGMELCAGSLADLFEASPARAHALRLCVLEQCGAALVHCHGRGVMHRDLKMENVLFNATRGHTCEAAARFTFKLADFGVSRLLRREEADAHAGAVGGAPAGGGGGGAGSAGGARAGAGGVGVGVAYGAGRGGCLACAAHAPQRPGIAAPSIPPPSIPRYATGGAATRVVGTPLYMAAEVFDGGEYGRACDVYSLGCVYRELLTSTRLCASRAVRFDRAAHALGRKPVHVPRLRAQTGVLAVLALLVALAAALPALDAALDRPARLDGRAPLGAPALARGAQPRAERAAPQAVPRIPSRAALGAALGAALTPVRAQPAAAVRARTRGRRLRARAPRAAPPPAPPPCARARAAEPPRGARGARAALGARGGLVLALALCGLTLLLALPPLLHAPAARAPRERAVAPPRDRLRAARRGALAVALHGACALVGACTWLQAASAWATLPVCLLLLAPAGAHAAHAREVALCNAMVADETGARPTADELRAQLASVRGARALADGTPLGAALVGGMLACALLEPPAAAQLVALTLACAAVALLVSGVAPALVGCRLRAVERAVGGGLCTGR
ncbi:hypothetical protein KFE25_011285 [Diacronema lutheri]|uniref:non-specific serine/threonine protein kinase n=1 Tax=Diacronema lutheri TaxID=2081491 RepID=A0A8J6C4L7_DIALT|nr:hypothetical protein KFE25_011285 [Diacronema lutheri]